MPRPRSQFWRYVRAFAAPVLLWGLFIAVLIEPMQSWLRGEDRYDTAALREWIEEARVFRETLPEMVRDYVEAVAKARTDEPPRAPETDIGLRFKADNIRTHLQSLGDPPTKMYAGQLPLFPVIYCLEVRFAPETHLESVLWDSEVPRHASQYQELRYALHPQAELYVQYQFHAYNKRQHNEQAAATRLRWVSLLAVAATVFAFLWIYLVQRREREHERQRLGAEQQISQTERRLLEEELRRGAVERQNEETERKLLEQRLATQAAERQALELKSQLYASIGIMAGSYAHNIKNLLVRPNDLLRRCLEHDGLSTDQEHMLHEVRQTLGTVTERLQQILRTVRRDPSKSELARLDLNEQVADLYRTWRDLAADKWKLTLTAELSPEPLWIEADPSHLQQAVENLVFNARDATFEMRNHLRDQARREVGMSEAERRQALIAAAAWRGTVRLRTRREGAVALLEVQDNGVGMSEEVRRRCTETHFSTKRDNAIYEGISTGMGLGLSFVVAILEHHHATLEIDSTLLGGTTFRARFALAPD
jgi:signal transduction histidine kinase